MLLTHKVPYHATVVTAQPAFSGNFWHSPVRAEAAPRLNVMELKALNTPAILAAPAVPLQNFTAEFVISLRLEFQAWLFCSNSSQGTT